jgi:hypothetical protein
MADLVFREVDIRPSTFIAGPPARVQVTAATTTRVRRHDARGEYDEVLDMRGADLSGFIGGSVLNGHRVQGIDNVMGVVTDARVEGEELIATLQFSERDDFAPVIRDIEAGILRSVSIGYEVDEWRD